VYSASLEIAHWLAKDPLFAQTLAKVRQFFPQQKIPVYLIVISTTLFHFTFKLKNFLTICEKKEINDAFHLNNEFLFQ